MICKHIMFDNILNESDLSFLHSEMVSSIAIKD